MKDNIVEINTEGLQTYIDEFKNINKELRDITDELNKKCVYLKDYWESDTANYFFEDYDDKKKIFDEYNSLNDDFVMFLDKVVNPSYVVSDKNTDKKIDELAS